MAYTGFDKLKAQLGMKPGVKNPAALAASIGENKFGKDKFEAAAASGTKMENVQPKRKFKSLDELRAAAKGMK